MFPLGLRLHIEDNYQMNRKRNSEEVSKIHFDEARGNHPPRRSVPQEDIEVTLLMGTQRVPLSIKVPSKCNMKILKSILWFHLKKVLTIKEYNNILGFETQPQDYLLDYKLENGLGMLTEPINLTLFLKDTRHGPTSLLHYKICKLVSEGGFSKVYLLRNHETGEFVVGKFMLRQGNSREMVGN